MLWAEEKESEGGGGTCECGQRGTQQHRAVGSQQAPEGPHSRRQTVQERQVHKILSATKPRTQESGYPSFGKCDDEEVPADVELPNVRYKARFFCITFDGSNSLRHFSRLSRGSEQAKAAVGSHKKVI